MHFEKGAVIYEDKLPGDCGYRIDEFSITEMTYRNEGRNRPRILDHFLLVPYTFSLLRLIMALGEKSPTDPKYSLDLCR